MAIEVVEAQEWRVRIFEELENREKSRNELRTNASMAWLNVHQEVQDDELDRILN